MPLLKASLGLPAPVEVWLIGALCAKLKESPDIAHARVVVIPMGDPSTTLLVAVFRVIPCS